MAAVGGDRPRLRHRRRGRVRRGRQMKLTLSEAEWAEVRAAAVARRITPARFAAEAALAVARCQTAPVGETVQRALQEVLDAQTQARRIGINLNQAVRALNTTGVAPDGMQQSAAESIRIVRRLDCAAERIARMLRGSLR